MISGGGFFSSMEQQTQRIMEKFKIHGVKRKYMSYVIELYKSINIEYFIIQCSDWNLVWGAKFLRILEIMTLFKLKIPQFFSFLAGTPISIYYHSVHYPSLCSEFDHGHLNRKVPLFNIQLLSLFFTILNIYFILIFPFWHHFLNKQFSIMAITI